MVVAAYLSGLVIVAAGGICILIDMGRTLRYRRRHRMAVGWRPKVSLAILALIGFYLVAEVGASAWLDLSHQRLTLRDFRHKELNKTTPIFTPHPFLLYTKNPKHAGVNRYGFFGPDWAQLPTSGTLRVACIGGSTSEDGYPERLQTVLAERLGRPVEVLNFGTSGWTTAQSLTNYELNVRHFHPDVVVIHHAANDFKVIGFKQIRTDYSQAFNYPKPPQLRPDHLFVHYLNSYALLKWAYFSARDLKPGPSIDELVRRTPNDWSDANRQITDTADIFQENIQVLARDAIADGASVILSTMPYSRANLDWSPDFQNWMSHADDALRAIGRSTGLPLVDLDRRMEGQEQLFIDPVHLNAEGVKIKSEMFALVIQRDLASSHSALLALP